MCEFFNVRGAQDTKTALEEKLIRSPEMTPFLLAYFQIVRWID